MSTTIKASELGHQHIGYLHNGCPVANARREGRPGHLAGPQAQGGAAVTVYRYDELDEDAYHRHPALSVSTAKRLLKPGGPAKVKWDLDHGRTERRVFDLGHAAHKLVLGVGAEIVDVGIDLRTKAAQEAEREARADGKVPLRTADCTVVLAMAEQLQRHPLAAELFSDGTPELSLFGTDPVAGTKIRGRVDWLRPDGTLVDYKTSENAAEKKFATSALDFGYHMQAPWYLDLAAQLDLGAERFLFVVQEKKAPYLVNVIELDSDFLALGREHNRMAIDLWVECHATGQWPGYDAEVTTVAPPHWVRPRTPRTDLDAELLAELNRLANL